MVNTEQLTLNEIIIKKHVTNILTLKTYFVVNYGVYCDDILYRIIKIIVNHNSTFNPIKYLQSKNIICSKMNPINGVPNYAWYHYVGTHWNKYDTCSDFNIIFKNILTAIFNNAIKIYEEYNNYPYNETLTFVNDIVMTRTIYNKLFSKAYNQKNNFYKSIQFDFSKIHFDLNDSIMSFNNCIYDYKQHISFEHNYKYLLFENIGYDYKNFDKNDTQINDIEEFLNDIFIDELTKEYFMMVVSIYLTKGCILDNYHFFVGDTNIIKIIKELVNSIFGNFIPSDPMSFGMDVYELKNIDNYFLNKYNFTDNLNISICDRYISYKKKRINQHPHTFIPIAYDHVIINNNNIIMSHANNNISEYKQSFLFTVFKYHKKYLEWGLLVPPSMDEFYNRICL